MKKLINFLGLAMMALVLFSSCSKEEVTATEQLDVTLELFETTNLDELITLLDLQETTLTDASFIGTEKPTSSQEVESRNCCDVGSNIHQYAGTNSFRFSLKSDEGSKYIVTVWKDNQFWSGGIITSLANECFPSLYLTDTDSFAPIQQGEEYVLRIFLYNETGPFCDLGQRGFDGQ